MSSEEVPVDLEEMTDEELDAHRREVLAERERRQKLAEGLDTLGRAICDYCRAARIEAPEGTPTEVGAEAIEALTGHIPPQPEQEP
ncbi:hypothetical protein [Nesterenkonia suensis]